MKTTKIQTLFNHMLVKPVEKKQVLLSEQNELCLYGEVVSKGPDVSTSIKVGDKIGYVIWGLKHLEIEGQKYYFVPEEKNFLLCKVND